MAAAIWQHLYQSQDLCSDAAQTQGLFAVLSTYVHCFARTSAAAFLIAAVASLPSHKRCWMSGAFCRRLVELDSVRFLELTVAVL